MIKKIENWTFTECQAHAKGLLEGIMIGSILTFNIMAFGCLIYQIFK